jgi:hypothetical protein
VSPIEPRSSSIAAAAACNEKRRILAGDLEGAVARARVGAVLHPAMHLAFADSASFEQNASSPLRSHKPDIQFFPYPAFMKGLSRSAAKV